MLEIQLELEQTARSRMDTQIRQLKEEIAKLNHECDSFRTKVGLFSDLLKNEGSRFQVILEFKKHGIVLIYGCFLLQEATSQDQKHRDLEDNYTALQQKETEGNP